MNLRAAILAFLAARAPASFDVGVIHLRVSRSGLLDAAPALDQVMAELQTLSGAMSHPLVDVDVNPVTKEASWRATDAGVRRWTLDGRPMVGG